MSPGRRFNAAGQNVDFRDDRVQLALRELLAHLRRSGYAFVVPTPETHRRVLQREADDAGSLRDVFGWNKRFHPRLLGALFEPLAAARLVAEDEHGWRSLVRVGSADGDLLLHSPFPTDAADAVFLGPDSYRFVRFLRDRLQGERFERAVDFGAGAGVGGLALARCAAVKSLSLIDVNPQAVALARLNAEHAGIAAEVVCADGLGSLGLSPDLVIGNPPYIAGSRKTYSDGGSDLGIEAAVGWARSALTRLVPGGRVVMYTGSPIVGGDDPVRAELAGLASHHGATLEYEEIDPDVFGEELSRPAYRRVDRIAAVGAEMRRPR
jgi:methylase of polypeptide subunit release factors